MKNREMPGVMCSVKESDSHTSHTAHSLRCHKPRGHEGHGKKNETDIVKLSLYITCSNNNHLE